jgi:hypothetical protein
MWDKNLYKKTQTINKLIAIMCWDFLLPSLRRVLPFKTHPISHANSKLIVNSLQILIQAYYKLARPNHFNQSK